MTELNVSRKSISKLLSEMQSRKYVIPEYQRPYKWNIEKCETLWKDITDFFEESENENREYFLGTIVTCRSEGSPNEVEVIDGQQRITSLFLMLRAFYSKLEMMSDDDNVRGLKSQIGPCIWDVNMISRKVEDLTKIHLESRVSSASDNEILIEILHKGTALESSTSKYSENYNFFFSQCEEYARNNPLRWQALCIAILNRCIVLPIDCEKEDTALTIFNTLNDRGLPLSDSDIFKAQMYKHLESDKRQSFAKRWKDLQERCNTGEIDTTELFRYYSHYLRASCKDKSKEIGLRKYYSEKSYDRLKIDTLMDDLEDLANFWCDVHNRWDKSNHGISSECFKYFHCLHHYPNDFWKYIVSVYFLCNFKDKEFGTKLSIFLKRTTAYLFAKFIEKPTVNAIKDDAYVAMIEIVNGSEPTQRFSFEPDFEQQLAKAYRTRIARSLITLHTYLNPAQTELIPLKFEIEHIFPVKWQNTNYNGWSEKDAQEQLDRFGNKVAMEKKLNIQAGNGYFGKKKTNYKQSKIENVKLLGCLPQDDWKKEDIEERDKKFILDIMLFLKEHA